ncbi:hypothetical protein, partial [Streptomyces exfoliatus]|uniref:hypothetical protein n=1 Tax=Streptomyces exfoliatus TaxID=1905 RepID=UPI0005624E34
ERATHLRAQLADPQRGHVQVRVRFGDQVQIQIQIQIQILGEDLHVPYVCATRLPPCLIDHTSRSSGSEASGNLPLSR